MEYWIVLTTLALLLCVVVHEFLINEEKLKKMDAQKNQEKDKSNG